MSIRQQKTAPTEKSSVEGITFESAGITQPGRGWLKLRYPDVAERFCENVEYRLIPNGSDIGRDRLNLFSLTSGCLKLGICRAGLRGRSSQFLVLCILVRQLRRCGFRDGRDLRAAFGKLEGLL